MALLVSPVTAQVSSPQFPAIGLDTGPAITLLINGDGTLTMNADPSQPPYDGIEDTYFGIINNSQRTVNSIRLQSPNPIFSFDGDGLCTAFPSPGCFGPTGYEGPGVSFDSISPDRTSGNVSFGGGLAPGASSYFSLELAISTICPPISGVVALRQCQRPTQYGFLPSNEWYCGNSNFGPPNSAGCHPGTISYWGCLLTAYTMLFNYIAPTSSSQSIATTPEALNSYLQNNDGFADDLANIDPNAIASFSQANNVPLYWTGFANRDDFTLNNYLCSGLPVVLGVHRPTDTGRNTHFVLAIGQTTTTGGTSSYLIVDPDQCSAANPGNTLAPYGNSYDSMRLFTTIPRPLTDVRIIAHSPVELLLTDSQGNQTGLNPFTGLAFENIPASSYSREAIEDDFDYTLTLPEIKVLEVLQPSDGKYSLQVFGTGNGEYSLDFVGYDSNGKRSKQTFKGNATLGSSEVFKVNYSSTPGSQIDVTPADTTPPILSGLPVAPLILWPPNHSLLSVATISATDPETGVASFDVTATSNEAPDSDGPDIVITGSGTGPRTVQLRAERLGTGNGRTYTINVNAVDGAGNETNAIATIVVPHDLGK